MLEEQLGFSDKEISSLNSELTDLRLNYSNLNIRKRPEFLEISDDLECRTRQYHQLESKVKMMANKIETLESGIDSECSICFETVNADRKWTAFKQSERA